MLLDLPEPFYYMSIDLFFIFPGWREVAYLLVVFIWPLLLFFRYFVVCPLNVTFRYFVSCSMLLLFSRRHRPTVYISYFIVYYLLQLQAARYFLTISCFVKPFRCTVSDMIFSSHLCQENLLFVLVTQRY